MNSINLNPHLRQTSEGFVLDEDGLRKHFINKFPNGEYTDVLESFIADYRLNPSTPTDVFLRNQYNLMATDLYWKNRLAGESFSTAMWDEGEWRAKYVTGIYHNDFRIGFHPVAIIKGEVTINLDYFMNKEGGVNLEALDKFVNASPAYRNFNDRDRAAFKSFKDYYADPANNKNIAGVFGKAGPTRSLYLSLQLLSQERLSARPYCLAGQGYHIIGVTLSQKAPDDNPTQQQHAFGGYQFRNPGQFSGERYREQYGLHQQDPWEHVTNDMLVQLLNHFSLTQILPFMPIGNRVQVPSGLELVQLIQSRLMPSDYRGYRPGPINQFDPRFSGGFAGEFRPFPPCWNGGNTMNVMTNNFNAPQASYGRYARQAFNGDWVWYPETPVFTVIPVDRTSDKPQDTLEKFLTYVLSFIGMYGNDGESHIGDMVKEIRATLENHQDTMGLFLHGKVTLFVGERSQMHPSVGNRTNNHYTNWVLVSGEWEPHTEMNPKYVINTIESIGRFIPDYKNFGHRPGFNPIY